MATKEEIEYAKEIAKQAKKAGIIVEDSREVAEMLGLQMTEFEILSGPDTATTSGAYCADKEILIDFQGKEMRIYINDEGKLSVYTD
jgi:uncharacterized protein YhbP (UPF0306 family)